MRIKAYIFVLVAACIFVSGCTSDTLTRGEIVKLEKVAMPAFTPPEAKTTKLANGATLFLLEDPACRLDGLSDGCAGLGVGVHDVQKKLPS